MAEIRMVDVEILTTDGRMLVLPRYTEPEIEQQILFLDKPGLTLPGSRRGSESNGR